MCTCRLLLRKYVSRAAVGCGLLAQIWVILFASVGSTAMRAHTLVCTRGMSIVRDARRVLFHGRERDDVENLSEKKPEVRVLETLKPRIQKLQSLDHVLRTRTYRSGEKERDRFTMN